MTVPKSRPRFPSDIGDLSRFLALWFYYFFQSFELFGFPIFRYERTWWWLFQNRVMALNLISTFLFHQLLLYGYIFSCFGSWQWYWKVCLIAVSGIVNCHCLTLLFTKCWNSLLLFFICYTHVGLLFPYIRS
jgi:hypothetical protein